jgi:hypothetical protein
MTIRVRELLTEIESLPAEEKQELLVSLAKDASASDQPAVQYVDHGRAMAIADRIFTERAELFEKLAA